MAAQAAHRRMVLDVDDRGDQIVVRIAGDVCLRQAPRLRDRLRSLLGSGARQLVLHLDDCVFLDSAGLAVLVNARRRLRARGGDLVLRSPSRAAYRALALSGLHRTFRIEHPPALWGAPRAR